MIIFTLSLASYCAQAELRRLKKIDKTPGPKLGPTHDPEPP